MNRLNREVMCDVPATPPVAAMTMTMTTPTTKTTATKECVIVGGGLAGTLTALALAEAGRGQGVVLVEQDTRLLGEHTWSFHRSDLTEDERSLVAPFIRCEWPRQIVRFPGRNRIIETGYASISSADFARRAMPRLTAAGVTVALGRSVVSVDESSVKLEDGSSWRGQVVIDARGPIPARRHPAVGFQKFIGLELELTSDGPWSVPVVMDATVAQLDGFRFMYVLPFSPRRVLVEDTMYSNSPTLDPVAVERRVLDYVRAHGATVSGLVRRESGVLPLPLRGESSRSNGAESGGTPTPASTPPKTRPLALGYRGGFFHSVTGYSLPLAVRVARAVAASPTPGQMVTAVAGISRRLTAQRRFEHLLNRLLFQAMPPAVRWTALDRFYRLPEATIARFYASANTRWDRLRVLVGRPPVGMSWRRLLGLDGTREGEA